MHERCSDANLATPVRVDVVPAEEQATPPRRQIVRELGEVTVVAQVQIVDLHGHRLTNIDLRSEVAMPIYDAHREQLDVIIARCPGRSATSARRPAHPESMYVLTTCDP